MSGSAHLPSEPTLADRFPQRAGTWQLSTRRLPLGRRPLLMGIINVTPDSFSDGGRFYSYQAAVERGLQLAADGADLLDIGGESTRPYSSEVPVDEELQRVIPVVQELCEQSSIPVSIDTSKALVAQAALDAGAQVINDVTGLEGDPAMLEVARRSGAGLCIMHMQGTPATMQDHPSYDDVVEDIFQYLGDRRDALVRAGIDRDRICLDPGIGFGKTHEHNLTLLRHCGRFDDLGQPVLIGHSRKGFLAQLLGDKQADRTLATVGVALAVAQQAVQVIRVHDVRPVREALQGFEASGGLDGRDPSTGR